MLAQEGIMIFRKLKKEDIPTLAEICGESFGLDCYSDRADKRSAIYLNYFCGYLKKCNYAVAAENEKGEVVGVLLADIPGIKKDDRLARYASKTALKCVLPILFTKHGYLYFVYKKRIERIDRRLFGHIDAKTELMILAVAKEERMKGVAREMMERFTAEAAKTGEKRYFLYTDSYCDVEYYRERGYVEAASEKTVFADGEDSMFYIFTKEIGDGQ